MSELAPKTLRGFAEDIGKKTEEIFSAILGKTVAIEIGEVQKVTVSLFTVEFPTGVVSVKCKAEATPGELSFWFAPEGTAAIVDLMIMGDGTAAFNADEHLDGISEAVHQLTESLVLEWNRAGSPISFQPIQAQVDDNAQDFAEKYLNQNAIRVEFKIDDFGEVGAWLMIDSELAMLLRPPAQPAATARPAGSPRSSESSAMVAPEVNVRPAVFSPFDNGSGTDAEPRNLDLLMDVALPVTIELGRTTMLIRDVLELGPGSVVELDKLSGEPVDLFVNDRRFARGEVVVVDENFGVRITDLLRLEDRIKSLR